MSSTQATTCTDRHRHRHRHNPSPAGHRHCAGHRGADGSQPGGAVIGTSSDTALLTNLDGLSNQCRLRRAAASRSHVEFRGPLGPRHPGAGSDSRPRPPIDAVIHTCCLVTVIARSRRGRSWRQPATGDPAVVRCSADEVGPRPAYVGAVDHDMWVDLADEFADGAYASVKGRVRTYVLHQHLLEHLPAPPARVLDVGGGAGHQSFPLAQAGYDVTLLDPSSAMLNKAQQRLERLPGEAQRRVMLVEADGEDADEAVRGQRFAAVLCHGVLGYLERPAPVVDQLCRCAAAGGVVSIMAGNANAMAVRPALERRWHDALAAFDAKSEIGVLGIPTRAHAVEELSELLRSGGVEPVRWYGVWLFVDWLEFSGAALDPSDTDQVEAAAAVELEASRRDPYRQLSRTFHLVGRKAPS
jgi:S-adenosylmethionine-dependent methyltransferase